MRLDLARVQWLASILFQWLALILFVIGSKSPAQVAEPLNDGASEKPAVQKTNPEAKQTVEQMSCSMESNGQSIELERQQGPLGIFESPSGGFWAGTIWVWTAKGGIGRPQAILGLSLRRDARVYEFGSFSAKPLTINLGTGETWSPRPGWEPRRIDDGPQPAETERGRLTQLKSLARRFSGFEHDLTKQRFELRLVAQPIYRYKHASESELDGAVFAFCVDIDTEALLVIELAKAPSGETFWQYQFQRMTIHELTLALDDKTVWEQPEMRIANTMPEDPYWVLWQSRPEQE